MEAMPPLAAFAARYDAGAPQVVWTRLVADLETPVSAYLKLAADKPMSFLLESVEGGAARGRYSVIGLEPDLVWRADGDQADHQPHAGRQARRLHARGTADARLAARPPRRIRSSSCRPSCRRWRPACSATWATTPCA